MMSNRFFATFLGLVMALSLAACGGSSSDADACDGIADGKGGCFPKCMTNADCKMGEACNPRKLKSGEMVNICQPSVAGISGNPAAGAGGQAGGMNPAGGAAAMMMTPGTPGDGDAPVAGGAAADNMNGMNGAGDGMNGAGNGMNGNGNGNGMNGNGMNGNGMNGNGNGGGNVDPNAPPTVQACSAWLACVDMCPEAQGPNDAIAQQCYQQCTNGNPQGAQVYQTWVECARNNQCVNQITNMIDQDCLFDACIMEVEACFGKIARPLAMEGADGASCSDFLGCVQNCPQGQDACRDACVEAASPMSFQKYRDVISCLQDNNCWDANDMLSQECFDTNCGELWTECIVDGRTFGNGTCGDIHGCFFGCDLMDSNCQEGCLERGTREAWFVFQDYLGCAGDAMCNSQMTCDDACPAERMECYAMMGGGNVNPPAGGEAAPAGGAPAPAGGAPAAGGNGG
jgi:hypothetical protein